MILVILLAFESVIIVHQKQYYNHPQHQKPATGIIFPGINRDQADTDLVHCAMFLVNYGFYKFGKEAGQADILGKLWSFMVNKCNL